MVPSAAHAHLCPYATCGEPLGSTQEAGACGCESRRSILLCPSCSATNRTGAHFCRRCRTELEPPPPAEISGIGRDADFLSIRGRFRRAPLLSNGLLYALETGGKLISLAPRKGARPREVAELGGKPGSSRAGFNTGAVVEAANSLRGLRGYLYLAVSPDSLEAVSLDTGRVSRLYEPLENEAIAANSSEEDSTGLKGLAATEDFCAIAVRKAGGEIALTLLYYSWVQEQPLKIRGTEVCGPVICGRLIVLCSDESVGVYDTDSGRAYTVPLPADFHPMMNREQRGIGLAPGAMPLAVLNGAGGVEAWIAGYGTNRPGGREPLRHGLLQVSLDQITYQFHDVAGEAPFSMHSLPQGGFFVSTSAGVQFPAQPEKPARRVHMREGMPVGFDGATVTYFRPAPQEGWHEIAIDSEGAAAKAYFPDPENECNEDSCCGVLIDGKDVVVPYLKISFDPNGEGLKFAHWRFA